MNKINTFPKGGNDPLWNRTEAEDYVRFCKESLKEARALAKAQVEYWRKALAEARSELADFC